MNHLVDISLVNSGDDRVNHIFKAMLEPIRRDILLMLYQVDELCVCDIEATLKQPQPKVSRHLAYLRQHHLVVTRKQGKWVHYRLAQIDLLVDILTVLSGYYVKKASAFQQMSRQDTKSNCC